MIKNQLNCNPVTHTVCPATETSRSIGYNQTWGETFDTNGISLGKDFAFTQEKEFKYLKKLISWVLKEARPSFRVINHITSVIEMYNYTSMS